MAKKKWGDRKDAIWLKDIPAMNRIMAPLMPNRADNEAHISVDIDMRPMKAYLEKLNEGRTEDKYTVFHIISAAIGKAFVLRPRMNRFIVGSRMYQRKDISIAFTVKLRAENAVARFNRQLRRSSFVKTQVLPRENGEFSVMMSLDDETGNLMTLELMAPNQRQALRLSKLFQQKAENVYNLTMMELLDEEEDLED